MVVWAEIPHISNHMPTAWENTIQQMKELIVQNYNHPSVVVWGLSNETTMNGAGDKDLLENHHILNDLAHEMDKTRLTTMAVVSMCSMDEPYIQIPDTVSYNHYFGWYGGDTSMNGPWFDKFHAKHPLIPIGCSEYGCEALNWHTSNPQQGDYTEESFIRKVDVFNEEYRLKEQGAILNWFDITEKEGYLSLNSKFSEIAGTFGGKIWIAALMLGLKKKMDAGKQKKEKKDGNPSMNFNLKFVRGIMDMMGGFTVLRMTSMVGMVGVKFTKEDLLKMNAQLNKIRAPKKA